MGNLLSDVRYAFRALRKAPGFAAAALVVLALGIGANTAIFSVVNAALLRPLPFGHADRLVRMWHTPPAQQFPGMKTFSLSAANFLDWQQQNKSFESAAIYSYTGFVRTGGGEPENIRASRVSKEFFPTLEVKPFLGRTFLPEEDQQGRDRELVVSYEYWKNHLGADRSVIGRDITLNNQNYTIVGVMGPSFRMPSWAEMWTPMAFTPAERGVRGEHHYLAIARLKPGVSVDQAQQDLDAISRRLAEQYPADDRGWGASVLPLRDDMVSDVRPMLLVLLGAVAFVLLIACANVANLFLAKMMSRRKEVAIRAALGASRRRLLQQSLAETMVLAVAGGALGLLLANYGVDLITKFLASTLPKSIIVSLDSGVLAFTFGVSLLTGAVAGVLPAWRLANTDVNEALKQGLGRGGSDAGGNRTRAALVTAEVALSLMLLVGAGLMIRTLWALHKVDPGFEAQGVVKMQLSVPPTKYATPEAEITAVQETLRRVQAVPGVEVASAIDSLPLDGGGSTQPIAIEGRPALAMADQPEVGVRMITPGYVKALRLRLLRGRDITDADRGKVGPVLVSESMAKRFWPNEDAIGHRLTLTFSPEIVREIVGIVADVKSDALNQDPQATMYLPLAQLSAPPPSMGEWRSFGFTLAVRTNTDPAATAPAIVKAIHDFDPGEPVIDVKTMNDVVDESLSQQRFTMLLLATFAGLAVLLAAVGIYSVLSYSVRRRLREIGIRMALGAQVGDILRLIIVDGLRPMLIGIALGMAGALALGRVLASLVYGVSTRDIATLASVSIALVLVGVTASLLPAWRAAQVEPVQILHDE
jgi:putative ABC transport system permease protein